MKLTTFKQKISGWLYVKRVERRMKAFLRSLSRQIVDDSNVTVRSKTGGAVGHMVINVVKIDKSNYFLWQNCIARGWVEEKYPGIVLADGSAVSTVRQKLDGTFEFTYILTKLGWDIINRAYVLMYTAIILNAVGLILALYKLK